MAAEGVANDRIATDLRVSATSVRSWRRRFSGEGLARFAQVRAGRGLKPSISAETVEAIVQATLRSNEGSDALELPDDGQAVRVSAATVQRIWHARGSETAHDGQVRLSNDPAFEEKLTDVVGLHLSPPEKAVVLCMDEKSQVRASDHTRPSRPMKKSRAGSMTHGYQRNGTTTLFAALDVLTGSVIGPCLPRHRHEEFLKFPATVDREVPNGLAAHLILS